MCAVHLQLIGAWLARAPAWLKAVPILAWIALTVLIARLGLSKHSYIDLCYGGFAAYLICCSIVITPLKSFLLHYLCQWSGKVSFSLYLIHWPILMTFSVILSHVTSRIAFLIMSVPAILLAAYIMKRWVERPAHHLGRHLSIRLETRARSARLGQG